MTDLESTPTIILVPGHWLGAWAWEDVVAHLDRLGYRTNPLTLPGLDPDDPGRSGRTLADQADAIIAAMREARRRCGRSIVLVGHSGANAPITLAIDRHPELVDRVIWVDSGPASDGAGRHPDDLVELPLPSFEVLAQQASLDGLDDDVLELFRRRAVPEPVGVLNGVLQLKDDARRDIATTLVCCSIPGEQVMAMAVAGHPMMAEVAQLRNVRIVDLPTGHWPMWSRPWELAEIISAAIDEPLQRKNQSSTATR